MHRSFELLSGGLLAAIFAFSNVGLAIGEEAPETETEISEALSELPANDRKAAEAQRYCPVMLDKRLGSMGAPVKLIVNGQPVFVCCKSCSRKALSNSKATLATVKNLNKAAAGLAKLSAEDRKLAELQRFCAVEEESTLGSMGKPVKLLLEGKPVFLCCAGCEDGAKADPKATLAKVKQVNERK